MLNPIRERNTLTISFWTSCVACNANHHIFCETHRRVWLVTPKNASLVESSRNGQKNIYLLDLTGNREWKQAWITQLYQHQTPAHILNQKCRCPWDFKVKNLYAYGPAQSQAVVYQGFSCQQVNRVSSVSGPFASDPVIDKDLPSNNAPCHWVNAS